MAKPSPKVYPFTAHVLTLAIFAGFGIFTFDLRGDYLEIFGFDLYEGAWAIIACVLMAVIACGLMVVGGVASRVGASRNKRSHVNSPASPAEVSPALEQLTTISNFRSAAANDSK